MSLDTIHNINGFHYIDVIWHEKYGSYIATFQISDNFVSKPVTKLKEIGALHEFRIIMVMKIFNVQLK